MRLRLALVLFGLCGLYATGCENTDPPTPTGECDDACSPALRDTDNDGIPDVLDTDDDDDGILDVDDVDDDGDGIADNADPDYISPGGTGGATTTGGTTSSGGAATTGGLECCTGGNTGTGGTTTGGMTTGGTTTGGTTTGGTTTGGTTTGGTTTGGTTTGGTTTGGTTTGGTMTGAGVCDPDAANCEPSWICSPWESTWNDNGTPRNYSDDTSNDQATRTCMDECSCPGATGKPVESATLPALDYDAYICQVEPVLDRGCSFMDCHGNDDGSSLRIYARGRFREQTNAVLMDTVNECGGGAPNMPAKGCTGSNECACQDSHTALEMHRNFDAVRGLLLGDDGQQLSPETDSQLLQQPLIGSSYEHDGVKIFNNSDPRYTTLKNFLTGTSAGGALSGVGCNNPSMRTN